MALFVNGDEVVEAQIELSKAQLCQMPGLELKARTPEEQEAELEAMAHENVVTGLLINQEVAARKVEVSPEAVDAEFERIKAEHGPQEGEMPEEQIAAVKNNLEVQLKIDKLLDDVCGDLPEPSEEDVRACYEANKEDFAEPEQVRAMHIVKHVEGDNIIDRNEAHNALKEIQQELEDGANFEEVADRHSDCPGQGADLGFFTRGQMVQEFEDVVFKMEVGEISGIFHTCFGLHIAQVTDRRPAVFHSLEEVGDAVRQRLHTEAENARIDEFIDELRAKASIEEK